MQNLMPWKDIICLFTVALGVILFLYGANYYDVVAGWAGIFLIVIGLVLVLVFRLYDFVGKKAS